MRVPIVFSIVCCAYCQIITQIDHKGLFSGAATMFWEITLAVTALVVLYFDKRQFNETKKLNSFGASFIGLTALPGCFLVLFITEQMDKIPSKIHCITKNNDFNGVAIDFREDGTYKLTSWCMGEDIYRGKYKIKDSIITIDESKIENFIVSNRFVIRQDRWIGGGKESTKSVYQIDQQGQVIRRSTDFRVDDDWKN